MRQQAGSKMLLLALFFFFSFSVSANDHVDRYINGYKDIAQREMIRSGIPASIIIAQGIHESSWGRGALAINSNNHFGIKCKDYWTGPTYYIEDDDYMNGKLIKSCFRAYDNVEQSYIDHTDFLVDNDRYASLFNYSTTDYKSWAKGLKKCGYATDPAYAEKLVRIIETHQLYRFDNYIQAPAVPVFVMDAPSFFIPDQFLQNNFSDDPIVEEVVTINETTVDNYTPSIAPNTDFDYEVPVEAPPVPRVEEDIVLVPFDEDKEEEASTISFPEVNSTFRHTALTDVITNNSSKDKRMKNLGRKPRSSSSAGPR